jgi:signal transduction histidine kinase
MRRKLIFFVLFNIPIFSFGQILNHGNLQKQAVVEIGKGFKEKSINTYFYTNPHVEFNKNTSHLTWDGFEKNEIQDRVHFGIAKVGKKGLSRVKIYNPCIETRSLVLELENQAIDHVKFYNVVHDSLFLITEIKWETPLEDRLLMTHRFALPFEILPGDTTELLLITERYSYLHAFDGILWDKKHFEKNNLSKLSTYSLHLGLTIVLAILTFWIGISFKRKEILYYSLNLCLNIFTLLSFIRFFDEYLNSNLSSSYLLGFSSLLTGVSFYPFLITYVSKKIEWKPFIKWVTVFIVSINLFVVLYYFVPFKYFPNKNVFIFYSMQICFLMNALWVFYIGVYCYFKKGLIFPLLLNFPISSVIFFYLLSVYFSSISFTSMPTISLWSNSSMIFLVTYVLINEFRKELKEQNELKEKLSEQKDASEEIRKVEIQQIGRNLHDQLGNTLASALGFLSLGEDKKDQVELLIRRAINETRFISHNLVLNEGLLNDKLERLTERFDEFSETNFHFYDHSNGKMENLSPIMQQNLYVIVQELLTNIIKHSKARNAYVQLFDKGNTLEITVEDDEVGLEDKTKSGIGIKNIKKRGELMDLNITMESTPNGLGTIIEIKNEN